MKTIEPTNEDLRNEYLNNEAFRDSVNNLHRTYFDSRYDSLGMPPQIPQFCPVCAGVIWRKREVQNKSRDASPKETVAEVCDTLYGSAVVSQSRDEDLMNELKRSDSIQDKFHFLSRSKFKKLISESVDSKSLEVTRITLFVEGNQECREVMTALQMHGVL